MTFGSPQLWTTLPAESNSIIGGAIAPALSSARPTSCRLRISTWSLASTHSPPSPPLTQRLGNGLGHELSNSYFGAAPCARGVDGLEIATASANAAQAVAPIRKLLFIVVSSLGLPCSCRALALRGNLHGMSMSACRMRAAPSAVHHASVSLPATRGERNSGSKQSAQRQWQGCGRNHRAQPGLTRSAQVLES